MASCLPIYLTYHTKTSVDYGFVKLFKRDAETKDVPERLITAAFRTPKDVYAPPEELFNDELAELPYVEARRRALDAFEERWGDKYPTIAKLWRTRWNEVIPFLAFPEPIRKVLYTTNAVESLNFQFRKALKPRGHFPTDEAALKLLYLALQNHKAKGKPPKDWRAALAHFQLLFADRFPAG